MGQQQELLQQKLQQLLQFGGGGSNSKQNQQKLLPLPSPVFVSPPALYQSLPFHLRPAAGNQLQQHYRSAAALLLLHLHARTAAAEAAAASTAATAAGAAAAGWRYSLVYLDGLGSAAALQQAECCGGFAPARRPAAAAAAATDSPLPLFPAEVWIDAWPLLQQHASLQQQNRFSLQLALVFAALVVGDKQQQQQDLLLLLRLLALLLQGDSSFCCNALCCLLSTPQPLLLCYRSTIAQHLLPLFLGVPRHQGAALSAWLLLQHAYTLHSTPPAAAAAAAALLQRQGNVGTSASAGGTAKRNTDPLPAAAASSAATAAAAAGKSDISATAHCLMVLRLLRRQEETIRFVSASPPFAAAVFLLSLRLLSAAAAAGSVLLLCREAEQLLLLLWRCSSSRASCLLLGGSLAATALGDVSRVRPVRAEIWPLLLKPPEPACALQLLATRSSSSSSSNNNTCWGGCCTVALTHAYHPARPAAAAAAAAANNSSSSSSSTSAAGDAPLLSWVLCCPPAPRLVELLLPPELLQSLQHLLQQEKQQQQWLLLQLQLQPSLTGLAAAAIGCNSKELLLLRRWFLSRWLPTENTAASVATAAGNVLSSSSSSSSMPWVASFVGDLAAHLLLCTFAACCLVPRSAKPTHRASLKLQLQQQGQQQQQERQQKDGAASSKREVSGEANPTAAAAGPAAPTPASSSAAAAKPAAPAIYLQLCCGALPVLQQLQQATERLPEPYGFLCLLSQRQQLCLRWLLFAAAAAPLPAAAAAPFPAAAAPFPAPAASAYPWCCSTQQWCEAALQLMRALQQQQQQQRRHKRIFLYGGAFGLPSPPDAFLRDAILLPTLQFLSLFSSSNSSSSRNKEQNAVGAASAAGVATAAAAGGGVASLLPLAVPLLQQLQQSSSSSSWVASCVDFLSLLLQHWAPAAAPLFVASVAAAFAAVALLQLLLHPPQLSLFPVEPSSSKDSPAAATATATAAAIAAPEAAAGTTPAATAAHMLRTWGVSLSVLFSNSLLNCLLLERGGFAVRVGLCSSSNNNNARSTGPFRVYVHPEKSSRMHEPLRLPLSPLLISALLQSQVLLLLLLQQPERYGVSLPGRLGAISRSIQAFAAAAGEQQQQQQDLLQQRQHEELQQLQQQEERQRQQQQEMQQQQQPHCSQTAEWSLLLQRQTCSVLGPFTSYPTEAQQQQQQQQEEKQQQHTCPSENEVQDTLAAAAASAVTPTVPLLPHRELLSWLHRDSDDFSNSSSSSSSKWEILWDAVEPPASVFSQIPGSPAAFCCCCAFSAAACAACHRRRRSSSTSNSNSTEEEFAALLGRYRAVCEGVAAEAATAAAAAAAANAAAAAPIVGGGPSVGRGSHRAAEVCWVAELLLRLTGKQQQQQQSQPGVAAAAIAAALAPLLQKISRDIYSDAGEPLCSAKRRKLCCSNSYSGSSSSSSTPEASKAPALHFKTETLCGGVLLLLLHLWPSHAYCSIVSSKRHGTAATAAEAAAAAAIGPAAAAGCVLWGEVLARLAILSVEPIGWFLLQLLAAAAAAVARDAAPATATATATATAVAATGGTDAAATVATAAAASSEPCNARPLGGYEGLQTHSTASSSSSTNSSSNSSSSSLYRSSRVFDAAFLLWLCFFRAAAGGPFLPCGASQQSSKELQHQHQQQQQLQPEHQLQRQLQQLLARDIAVARPHVTAAVVAALRREAISGESSSSSNNSSSNDGSSMTADKADALEALHSSTGSPWQPAAVAAAPFGRWASLLEVYIHPIASPLAAPAVLAAQLSFLPLWLRGACLSSSDFLSLLLRASSLQGLQAAATAAGICSNSSSSRSSSSGNTSHSLTSKEQQQQPMQQPQAAGVCYLGCLSCVVGLGQAHGLRCAFPFVSVLSPPAASLQQQQQLQQSLELPPQRLLLLRLPLRRAAGLKPTGAAATAAAGLPWRGLVLGWRLLGRELLVLQGPLRAAAARDTPLLLPRAASCPFAAVAVSRADLVSGASASSFCCSSCESPANKERLGLWGALQRGFHALADPNSSSSSGDTAPVLLLQPLHLPLADPVSCCSGAGGGCMPSAALSGALRELRDTAVRMVLLLLPKAAAAAAAAQQQHALQWALCNPGAVLSLFSKVVQGIKRPLEQQQQQEEQQEQQQQLGGAAVALHVPLHCLLPVLLESPPHPLLLKYLLWFLAMLGPLATTFASPRLLLLHSSGSSSSKSNSNRLPDCLCASAVSPLESLIDTVWSLLLIWFERAPWLLLHAFRCLKRRHGSSSSSNSSSSSRGGRSNQQQQQVFHGLRGEEAGGPLPWQALEESLAEFCTRRLSASDVLELPPIFSLRTTAEDKHLSAADLGNPTQTEGSDGDNPLQLPLSLAVALAAVMKE